MVPMSGTGGYKVLGLMYLASWFRGAGSHLRVGLARAVNFSLDPSLDVSFLD